jgi:hypothetical protein
MPVLVGYWASRGGASCASRGSARQAQVFCQPQENGHYRPRPLVRAGIRRPSPCGGYQRHSLLQLAPRNDSRVRAADQENRQSGGCGLPPAASHCPSPTQEPAPARPRPRPRRQHAGCCLHLVGTHLSALLRRKQDVVLEHALLRQPLIVLNRSIKRPTLTATEWRPQRAVCSTPTFSLSGPGRHAGRAVPGLPGRPATGRQLPDCG